MRTPQQFRITQPTEHADAEPQNRAERRHGSGAGKTPPPRTMNPTHGRVVPVQRQFLARKTG